MEFDTWTIVGSVAALLTSFGFLPQVIKMWKSKSVADVSVITFWQYTIGIILWLGYGIAKGDMVLTVANAASLLTLSVALFLYYQSRLTALENTILNGIRNAAEMEIDVFDMMRRQSQTMLYVVAASGGDIKGVAGQVMTGVLRGARVAGIDPGFAARSSAQGMAAGAITGAAASGVAPELVAEPTVAGAFEAVENSSELESTDSTVEGMLQAASKMEPGAGDAFRSSIEEISDDDASNVDDTEPEDPASDTPPGRPGNE